MKTTWKYGTGSSSACSAAIHLARACALTLRTVAVAAGVVGDAPMTAALTLLYVPTERGGAAVRDGTQNAPLLVRGEGRFEETAAVAAHHVGHFEDCSTSFCRVLRRRGRRQRHLLHRRGGRSDSTS